MKLNEAEMLAPCVYICVRVNERMNDVSARNRENMLLNALSMCTTVAYVWLSIRRGERFNLDRSVVVFSGALNVSFSSIPFRCKIFLCVLYGAQLLSSASVRKRRRIKKK